MSGLHLERMAATLFVHASASFRVHGSAGLGGDGRVDWQHAGALGTGPAAWLRGRQAAGGDFRFRMPGGAGGCVMTAWVPTC